MRTTMTIPKEKSLLYSPSWVNYFLGAIERVPLPYWLTYALIAVVESLLVQGAAWLDGTTPLWEVEPLFLLFPFRTWLAFAWMTYLNRQAILALQRFHPLLASDEEEQRLAQHMTTLPSRPVWIVNIVGILYFFILAKLRPIPALVDRPYLTSAFLLSGFIGFGLGSVIYYHTFHQLRWVRRIYAGVKTFDLFRLEPVYAFSALTARTSLAYVSLVTLSILFYSYPLTDIRSLVSYLIQVALSIIAFFLPLWDTHQRLAVEKRSLVAEANVRMDTTLQRLHRHVDGGEVEAIEGDRTMVEALLLERKVLDAIPTWPWQPATLRGIVTAILLPIVLFLLQLVIEQWFKL